MSGKRWSVQKYRVPRLSIKEMRQDGSSVILKSQGEECRLVCDDISNVDSDLLPTLRELSNPLSHLWQLIRDDDSSIEGLNPLLQELDHLGLIRDGNFALDVARQNEIVKIFVFDWAMDLSRYIATQNKAGLELLEHLIEELSVCPERLPSLIHEETNFYSLTFLLQSSYLRQESPVTFWLLFEGLRACKQASQANSSYIEPELSLPPPYATEIWSTGMFTLDDVRLNMETMGQLIRWALGENATRLCHSSWIPLEDLAGVNFVISLESYVSQLMTKLGSSPVVTAIQDYTFARRIIKTAFLQEYHVTCHFIDCVAPLLSKQFPGALYNSIASYFLEEFGHERFERDNCLKLGYTDYDIDLSTPLPLHLAFINIMTLFARVSPVAFFCSSMFTEGIIGTRSSLVLLASQAMPEYPSLAQDIGEHTALNDEADHRGVGREWMSHILYVPKQLQVDVSEVISYFVEMNWRLWNHLVEACTES
ncbi:MAG: iron-containing redox enzyme family protein [Microcystis aeruginosa LG13-03]|nr:iron-containing redox enzyme family protein [Microcystis aeruginosa LG13-13]NCR05875.1 iron-containing redox enzyme family protein [Microcystis aeruginosa LG13-03]NCR64202.1 iron-containing redox enzyme family protein [Microcystis aeruginosa LG11-05]